MDWTAHRDELIFSLLPPTIAARVPLRSRGPGPSAAEPQEWAASEGTKASRRQVGTPRACRFLREVCPSFLTGAATFLYPALFAAEQVVGLIIAVIGLLANVCAAVLGRWVNRSATLQAAIVTLAFTLWNMTMRKLTAMESSIINNTTLASVNSAACVITTKKNPVENPSPASRCLTAKVSMDRTVCVSHSKDCPISALLPYAF